MQKKSEFSYSKQKIIKPILELIDGYYVESNDSAETFLIKKNGLKL